MDTFKHSKSRAGGSSLVLVMIAVAVMLVLGTGLLTLDTHVRNWALRTTAEIASRTAADAGLTQAVYQMNEKLKSGPWNSSNLPGTEDCTLPNCEATYTFIVTGDVNNGYTIESVGRSGHFTRRVNASLRLKGIFDNAIYATRSILLTNSAYVDAQSSGLATDPNGNGTQVQQSAQVNGQIKTESWDLPMLMPPNTAQFQVSRGAISGSKVLTPADNGRYDSISLNKNKLLIDDGGMGSTSAPAQVVLYITGNVGSTGDVGLQQKSEVEIAADATLILYLDGNFDLRNLTKVNDVLKDPKRCLVIGTGNGQQFIIEQNVNFYGVIYAPTATITLSNNVDFKGAIVGRTVVMNNNATLQYDESLAGGMLLNFPVKFVVDRWWQGEEW